MPSGGKLIVETLTMDIPPDYEGREKAVQPGQYVMVAVSDTGQGMAKEVQSRIFEPFFYNQRKREGNWFRAFNLLRHRDSKWRPYHN